MHVCSNLRPRFALCLLATSLFTLAGSSLQAQKIDLNANGMSDVWEYLFNAATLNPNLDNDNDGVSNLKESIAATDPNNPNSYPRIPTFYQIGTNFTVVVPSALGKQYQLQSLLPSGPGPWTNWVVEATLVARTGTNITFTSPAGPTVKLFRIGIADVDTDGDGVNDWEEYQLGLDPTKPSSNNLLDSNGQPLSDYAYATNRMASQNIISITASDPSCIQPDSGVSAQDLGQFTITRGGFPLNFVSVNLALGGPGAGFATEGVDHSTLPRTVSLPPGVGSTTISVRPLAHTSLLSPVVAMLKVLPGSGYTVGSSSNASVTIYPSQTASGTGLTGTYYTNASATYANSANFNPANIKMTRTDTNVDFTWGTTSLPFANNGYYCVRWTGQVQPQYSETYYFVANTDDGVKLWINDKLIIDNWVSKSASDVTGSITLQAGVRYNIKMEYFQLTSTAVAHLSWYSASQAKQVIPTSRLYPSTVGQSASTIVSSGNAYGFLNQPFAFSVVGANSASNYAATTLPPGLSLNPTNGIISGTPSLAGDFQVNLTASNTIGVSAAGLTISIFDTGNSVVRELWTNAPGVNIADIPLSSPPSSVAALGGLQGITDFGDNYGERVRGFITVPTTGNYYFWVAGSDSAELWVSNDSEPVNKVRRAYVTPSGTASQQWNVQPNQKSGWLTLVAGQRYYVEVLHKAGVGAGDNWAVGWNQDPTGMTNAPAGLVPTYLLSRFYQPPPSVAAGTLYVADMLPTAGVTNMPFGTATLRLNVDNTRATLVFSFNGISSTVISEHVDNDPFHASPSGIMFDISDTAPQPDGSYLWNIGPVGTLSAADVIEVLNEGKGFITILTDFYPNGELVGYFQPAEGSPSFTPPAAAPAWTDDHTSASAASRFLIQSSFGPSPSSVASVQSIGYSNWIVNQLSLPASHFLPVILSNINTDPTLPYPGNTVFNTWWQLSTTAPDQLRQRVAFALSEILVVSDQGILNDNGRALSSFYDTLLDNAFGNFRSLLKTVTLTPAMGMYLNMQGNDRGSVTNGTHANENYAREIMQLFSIGLNRMWPDGSLIMDSTGSLVPTYDQNVIMGFAAAFTGWNFYQTNQANGRLPTGFGPSANYINPMVLVPLHHDLNTKLLLDNVVLPAAQGTFADLNSTNYDIYCSQDLELALDSIFNNQNVGPFICRELIQRLVTSSPSPGYLYRVVQTFNDNGSGVRGDMQAVIKAILLDYEARSTDMLSIATFGKQREPLLRITASARAFPAPQTMTAAYNQTNATITVTTPAPHRSTNSEMLFLNFTDTSGNPPPPSQTYQITVNNSSPAFNSTNFTFAVPGLSSGSYVQAVNATFTNMTTGTIDTTNIITMTISGHGLSISNPVYLNFTTGSAISGQYQIVTVSNANSFTVISSESVARSGSVLTPKWTGGGFTVTTRTNVLFSTAFPHNLNPGDNVFVNFTAAGSPVDGTYPVISVPDSKHFTFIVPTIGNQTANSATVYPLVPPPLNRSGTVAVNYGTWVLNTTDTGATFNLGQTPLNSPTVFNFFFPGYKFPGALSAAGLTTPEFQLTSDTGAALQMNFIEGGVLMNSSNTNGLSSFNNGGGAIVIDLGPYMNSGYTANITSLNSLVDALNSLLCGGTLNPSAKPIIANYALTITNANANVQMRDRVRAVVHLILTSPDFTVQR